MPGGQRHPIPVDDLMTPVDGDADGVARGIVYNAAQLVRGQLSKKKFAKHHYQIPKKNGVSQSDMSRSRASVYHIPVNQLRTHSWMNSLPQCFCRCLFSIMILRYAKLPVGSVR